MSGRFGPPEKTQTVRDALHKALREGPATSKDLSGLVDIREKDVEGHLEHLARSLKHQGERLEVEPAHCLACGFTFKDRTRLSRPGACPECRSTRIEPPVFSIGSDEGE
jgi:predicted Zn-ribbon and HTH transcriptional regulator